MVDSTERNEANFDDLEAEEMEVTHKGDVQEEQFEEDKEPQDEFEEEEPDEGLDTPPDFEEEIKAEEEQPEENTTEEDPEYEEEIDHEYYSSLTEATGYELNSDEDIVAMAQRLDELEQLAENPLANLPKEVQMVANAIQNGGDYMSSLRLLSMDTEKMSDMELLKENYMRDSKVSSNQKLAEMQFEKDYENKYGILDQLNQIDDPDERAEFEQENAREIEYAKLSLEQDVKDAKESLEQFKEENTTKSPAETMSKEEQEEFIQTHLNSVKQQVSDFEGITLAFGENGDKQFNLQLADDQKEGLQTFLTNPAEFFREEIGFDLANGRYTEDGYDSMSSLYTLITNLDKLPELLGQYYMEQSDKKSVEEIVENREKPRSTNSKPQQEGLGIDLSDDPDW